MYDSCRALRNTIAYRRTEYEAFNISLNSVGDCTPVSMPRKHRICSLALACRRLFSIMVSASTIGFTLRNYYLIFLSSPLFRVRAISHRSRLRRLRFAFVFVSP